MSVPSPVPQVNHQSTAPRTPPARCIGSGHAHVTRPREIGNVEHTTSGTCHSGSVILQSPKPCGASMSPGCGPWGGVPCLGVYEMCEPFDRSLCALGYFSDRPSQYTMSGASNRSPDRAVDRRTTVNRSNSEAVDRRVALDGRVHSIEERGVRCRRPLAALASDERAVEGRTHIPILDPGSTASIKTKTRSPTNPQRRSNREWIRPPPPWPRRGRRSWDSRRAPPPPSCSRG